MILKDDEKRLEIGGYYANANGTVVAAVLTCTKGVDWAVYLGATCIHDPENNHRMEDTYEFVKRYGCKLTKELAMAFFPIGNTDDLLKNLRYRS